MPFLKEILKYKSLAIIGTEKNTGKTECLNHIIQALKHSNKTIAITSIGLDGESLDQVTETPKPEIEIYQNTIFLSSEKHFSQKQITAEILNVSEKQTALGRLVTARAIDTGKLIFSGPPDTKWLKEEIQNSQKYGVDLFLVDGALSRKSTASPSVTESMILTTGAALSANIPNLVKKTKLLTELIKLPIFESNLIDELLQIENGVWAIDSENIIHNLEIQSSLLLNKTKDKLYSKGNIIFASGIITDNILDFMRIQKNIKETVLIVKDFTKIFVSQESYKSFVKAGGKIFVLLKPKLISICVNPLSPNGFVLDSKKLREELYKAVKLPVYDIKALD
ncbi:MAG: hypothetical protein M0Q45_07220 [Bacteroidales bacterium]|nr:hypothetical protein [Bacteroidales bacterium]MCK9499280.1 hypothetical protein [Bacteroidales bacterium]MDY0315163.1 hypothetical protein [Bacteroidales bacterium]